MSDRICVYTCITGSYDSLPEVAQMEENVDYYCFTNNSNVTSSTWKIIPIENNGLDDRRLSRRVKMLGDPRIFENYTVSVWMDANVVWKESIVQFVATYMTGGQFSVFRHSQRNTVAEEAIACVRKHKDSKEAILRTLGFLRQEGFPDDLGLFETTVFIKKHNDPLVKEAMELWSDTLCRYSNRDQLSFPYVVWKTGLAVDTINLNVWNNPWFVARRHLSDPPVSMCSVYYGDPDDGFEYDRFYTYKYEVDGNRYRVDTEIPYTSDVIEICPADTIGMRHSELIISPEPEKIVDYGSIPYKGDLFFCTSNNSIKVYGSFNKGERLSFSVRLDAPDELIKKGLLAAVYNAYYRHRTSGAEQKKEIARLRKQLEETQRKQAETQRKLEETQRKQAETQRKLEETQRKQLEETQRKQAETQRKLEETQNKLRTIENSRVWRARTALKNLVK